jgi:hypothetical protein
MLAKEDLVAFHLYILLLVLLRREAMLAHLSILLIQSENLFSLRTMICTIFLFGAFIILHRF